MTVVPELRQLARMAPASRAETYAKAADEIDALRLALSAARTDAVLAYVAGAQQWGFVGTYPDLVAAHGVPEHIAKMDALLS